MIKKRSKRDMIGGLSSQFLCRGRVALRHPLNLKDAPGGW